METKSLFDFNELELNIYGPEDDEEIIMEDPEEDLDDTSVFNPSGSDDTEEVELSL